MNSSKLSLVPLQLASLCLDCEMIAPAHGRCIACGSVALLTIARTLSRPGAIQLPRGDNLAVDHIAASQVARYGETSSRAHKIQATVWADWGNKLAGGPG